MVKPKQNMHAETHMCLTGRGVIVSEPGVDVHQHGSFLYLSGSTRAVGTMPGEQHRVHGPPAPAHDAAPSNATLCPDLQL